MGIENLIENVDNQIIKIIHLENKRNFEEKE